MSASSSARPPGTLRFGRLGGADLLARPSLLLMGLLLVVLFAPRFEGERDPYVVATVFVLALYVSVLVHELAHLAVARAYGMRVSTVTLHLLGGETAIEGESRTPTQELVTSLVGPVASLVIGLGALAVVDPVGGVGADVLWSIGWVNLLVAAFNMLPGLPLDGGRVFRAVVWALTGSELKGIVAAAWAGRLAAVAIVVAVVARHVPPGRTWYVDVPLAVLVAAFLWAGAGASLRAADRSARINALSARALAEPLDDAEVAHTDLPALPATARGTVLLRAMAARPADTYLLVDDAGTPVGVLRSTAVDDAYRRRA